MLGVTNVDAACNVDAVIASLKHIFVSERQKLSSMLPLSRMATRLASWAPLQQAHLMSTTSGQMTYLDLQCSLEVYIYVDLFQLLIQTSSS